MQEFFKSKAFKILLVVVAFLVGLITFEFCSDKPTILKSAIKIALQPLIKTANNVNDSVSSFFDEFFKSGVHKEENILLKKEISKIRKNLIDFDKIKNENEQLRKLLEFKKENSNYEIEVANFVARDPNSLNSFTVDIGANKNIKPGNVVLTNVGLIGKVSKVDQTQSTISSILSLDEKIPAVVNLKQEKGLISGNANLIKKGLCSMNHLPKMTKAAPGDLIYTSGTNNAYPEGIVIGTINKILLNQNGISCSAVVKPAQDLNQIKEVMIIKNFLNSNKKTN